jgi:hypothetical protein
VFGIAAGIGVWRGAGAAPLLILLLGASVALTAVIEIALGIAPWLYALLAAVVALVVAGCSDATSQPGGARPPNLLAVTHAWILLAACTWADESGLGTPSSRASCSRRGRTRQARHAVVASIPVHVEGPYAKTCGSSKSSRWPSTFMTAS